MKLFISSSKKSEIFIPIGEGCPTECPSCSYAFKEGKSFTLSDIKKQIQVSHKLSDKYFSYFLYGVRRFNIKDLKDITTYIHSLNRKVKLQVDLNIATEEIRSIQKNTSINEYALSYKIATTYNFKKLISSIQFFSKQTDLSIQYHLLCNDDFIPLLERIIGDLSQDEQGFYNKELSNLFFTIQPLHTINYKNQSIDGIKYSSCLIKPLFDITTDQIIIHDHYEIDADLNIMFHNIICFLGKNKISNLKLDEKEVIEHFIAYRKHLTSLDHNLKKNCFKCISNGFNYKNL